MRSLPVAASALLIAALPLIAWAQGSVSLPKAQAENRSHPLTGQRREETVGATKVVRPENIRLRGLMAIRGQSPAALVEVEESNFTIVQEGGESRRVSLGKGRMALISAREIRVEPASVEITGPGGPEDAHFYLSFP
jgi:hypothetical protein